MVFLPIPDLNHVFRGNKDSVNPNGNASVKKRATFTLLVGDMLVLIKTTGQTPSADGNYVIWSKAPELLLNRPP